MRLGHALNAGAIAGAAAWLGVCVLTWITAMVVRLTFGYAFTRSLTGENAVAGMLGMGLLLAIFISVGVIAFGPYAYLREHYGLTKFGDTVVHVGLAIVFAGLISSLVFANDIIAFIISFLLFAVGGAAGIVAFRLVLRSTAPLIMQPLV